MNQQKLTYYRLLPRVSQEYSNPSISRRELSSKIDNITENGIKYHIQKLQKMGIQHREGPDYGSKWVVLNELPDS